MPRSWSEAVKACRKHPRKGANGRWCSCRVGWRYRLGMPDPVTGRTGRPEWSTTFPTKQAADAHQRETRQAIAERTFVRDRGATVGEYLASWLARRERDGLKPATIAGYRGVVDNHLIPSLGAHRLGDLRPDHVQGMLDRIAASPSKRPGKAADRPPVTAGTLANIRAALRSALNDAVRQQLVARNVATLVKLPPVRRAKPVAIDSDRLARFIAQADRDPLAALWLMDAIYGMRRGELLGLRWDDIDQAAELIRVRHTLTDVPGDHPCPHCQGKHRRLLFGTPKSVAGERFYPLVPPVTVALMEQRRRQDHERELYGADYADHRLVFAKPDGNPWRPDWISREFKRLMTASGAAVGLDKMPSLKVMRSTMVTNLHGERVPLETIAAVTGHSGGEVTRKHYLLVTAEQTRAQYEAIASRLTGGRSDRRSDRRSKRANARKGGTAKK